MSTPGGPPSDAEMRDAEQRTPLAPASLSNRNPAGASSPLAFPSSSPLKSQASNARAPQSSVAASSPLHFPTSSPSARTSRGQRTPLASARRGQNAENRLPSSSSGISRLDEPLFFPSSGGTTPRHQRRGEIHSSVALSSPSLRRNRFDNVAGNANQAQGGPARASSVFGGSQPTADGHSDTLSFSQHGVTSDAAAPGQDGVSKVIWGTNVSIGETMEMFRSFLRGFRLKYRWAHAKKLGEPLPPAATGNPAEGERLVYEGYLRRMRITDQTNLNLRISDLEAYPPSKRLKMQLIRYPQEMVPIMDQVLKDEMLEMAYEDQKEGRDGMGGDIGVAEIELMETKLYKVRPYGADAINMRDLNPSDIDKLVTVRGLVIRATPIIPEMKQAFFRCLVCNHTVPVEIDRGRIAEPDRCPRQVCNLQGSMSLIHNRCEFSDRQVVRIQETPDVVPDGQTPHTVSMCAYDELVDISKPGDRVEITGIFRSTPVRVNPRQRSLKSLYKTFVDILHIKRTNGKRLGVDLSTRDASEQAAGPGAQAVGVGGEEDDEDVEVQSGFGADADDADMPRSQDLEDKLRSIAERPDVYDLLSRSLAPSIYEMDDVKKGILLQLFGGTNKTISTGGGGGGPRYRGDINVLMVGDPGIAKSQILQYVHKIAPRGVYASGKGSSAVGLTAYVTRDPDTKQLVLESGALVLSDGGVCCIDEFDKMSEATRSVLHEVMEQQTLSIAKAGIITTLNARASILAAANPTGSRYNVNLPITKNIDLPPTLISRFDLVYLVLDKIDEANDRRLARHLVSLYLEDKPDTGGKDVLPIETLTAFISYARNRISPILTKEAGDALAARYVELRKVGEDPRNTERRITATTRQLESMIRLSEAHARMRFADEVIVDDVEEAARLIREAAKSSATDPRTGLIDLDLINTGRSHQQRKVAGDLRREFLQLLDEMGSTSGRATSPSGPSSTAPTKAVRYVDLIKALDEQSSMPVDRNDLSELLRTLEREGVVKTAGERERKTVRRISS